ncbi:MAG: phosphoribosylglycinamide formyltransferase [Bacteroidetes bacterium RIFCSPLOWO2_02_FULL_36_8]|nr:MAG: phosphoribosylglycinamide formyltransferase [Bacteroidetes bacterium RIFCSPLOWO2_02_FULL_36_8]OFY69421.1 MAG: phosphoribosylglycinamide formyltransferase [Bacteroidetes bacterium RIFCSPLOWO2_12_FULL_37_12]
MKPTALAVFASGNGSNMQNIVDYTKIHPELKVAVVYCNNPSAFVIQRAKNEQIPVLQIDKKGYENTEKLLMELYKYKVDYIILAGFLWLVPKYILDAFPEKILNIHPALLPSFGGKGMYGKHVHKAVLDSKRTESGISIHLVNSQYDKGKIIFQASCRIMTDETPESLSGRIHKLEKKYYPKIIHEYIRSTSMMEEAQPIPENREEGNSEE